MNIGFLERFPGKIDEVMEVYFRILEHNGIPYQRMLLADPLFWEKVRDLDVFIYKWGHQDKYRQIAETILPLIESQLKIKCFPDQNTCWHYDDKIRQYLLLKEHGFPAAESFVFWDKPSALAWAYCTEYPVVFKLKGGAGSLNVLLIKNKEQAAGLIRRMFEHGVRQGAFGTRHFLRTYNYSLIKISRSAAKRIGKKLLGRYEEPFYITHRNYAYFQKYYPGNEFDVRVTTAGNRVHAFRRFVRKNDFRASGSHDWDIDPEKIDQKLLRIALDISATLGFQAMAYDFVYDRNGEPRIIEMSYLYGGAGFPDFMNGYWDANLERHEGRFWPQYFELMDLLGKPDLRLPEGLTAVSSYSRVKTDR